ncbi:hypothetical protein QBC39DRAFT_351420 [Podospora conica]|nr:hypothetical protein QBC39DRAFT_351420 [Schizothecium conicum]
MTIEEYIGREQALSETALSANGGTRYYILHHKTDPNLIVSACEVLTKKAVVAASGSPVRVVKSYGLASVFTPPEFRGHGLASHMLRLVQADIDAQDAEFGALYSDIGRSFYTRLGWPDFPSPQLTMHLVDPNTPLTGTASSPAVTLLSDADIPSLCDRDCALVQSRLATASNWSGKTHVAFLPDTTQMTWHFTRDSYVAGVMRKGRSVQHRGARTAEGNSWVYWDHDLRENKLKILRVVIGDKDAATEVKTLLRAALEEAQDWGLPKVLVWAPGAETCAAATELWREGGAKLELAFDQREDGSIPSLRWRENKGVGEVEWHENEYYAWC